MLHIVTTSPFSTQSLETCLRYSSHQDEILLMQDAVFAGLDKTAYAEMLMTWPGKVYLYAPDVLARGVGKKVEKSLKLANSADFVALTVRHPQQINWQ